MREANQDNCLVTSTLNALAAQAQQRSLVKVFRLDEFCLFSGHQMSSETSPEEW
jgi:hypothetical protein